MMNVPPPLSLTLSMSRMVLSTMRRRMKFSKGWDVTTLQQWYLVMRVAIINRGIFEPSQCLVYEAHQTFYYNQPMWHIKLTMFHLCGTSNFVLCSVCVAH